MTQYLVRLRPTGLRPDVFQNKPLWLPNTSAKFPPCTHSFLPGSTSGQAPHMRCPCVRNKSIFAELGLKEAATWDEFKSNLKTIKEKKPDVTPWFIPGKKAWSLGFDGIHMDAYGFPKTAVSRLNGEEKIERLDEDFPSLIWARKTAF